MPPKRTVFHDTITDVDHFDQVIHEKEGRVNIIDCHLEWCGPCKCMEPNYQGLWFSIADGDPMGRVAFWQTQEDAIPEHIRESLQLDLVPRFVVFKDGKIIKDIKGAHYTIIKDTMDENLVEVPE